MAHISDHENDSTEFSLTPLIESAKLAVPPAFGENNANDGILALTKQHKHQPKKLPKPKSKPAFVMKLWTMVNDSVNKTLIDWLPDGKTFLVSNRELFVQKILPKYFKHSNFASFVRQLNMYGWHKVQDSSSGSLHSDEKWQFHNPNFQKDRPELLEKIVRNKPHDENWSQLDIGFLMEELQTLKGNQIKITQELSRVRDDNDLLWQELFQTREKNLLQNDKIEKILQFLASVYGNKVKGLEDGLASNQQQLTNLASRFQPVSQAEEIASSSSTLNDQFNERPRLMLKQYRHVSNPSSDSTPNRLDILDNSPIQEIVRTPQQAAPTNSNNVPNPGIAQIQPYRLSDFQPYSPDNSFVTPGDIQPVQINTNTPSSIASTSSTLTRPKLTNHPSYKELSKSIEQQGQSIDDMISKLQTATTPISQNPNPNEKFDIDDFLNEEFDDLDDDEIEEIQREDTASNLYGGVGGVKRKDEGDEEIEEIVNPSKKRKSDQFL